MLFEEVVDLPLALAWRSRMRLFAMLLLAIHRQSVRADLVVLYDIR
jgi:hypothetical protein